MGKRKILFIIIGIILVVLIAFGIFLATEKPAIKSPEEAAKDLEKAKQETLQAEERYIKAVDNAK